VSVPIVISTGRGRGAWVMDCLDSIDRGDVTVALSGTGGELGAIRMIYQQTTWPRWLMLQDSCVVKDSRLFGLVDEVDGPLLVAPHPSMYLAVYERKLLDLLTIPDVPAGIDREVGIAHETSFMGAYDAAHYTTYGADLPVLFPEFRDGAATRQEWRHGRNNLVLENQYLAKYKGTWR
jgi:hypothetical protein